jgi:hypothetical protein
MSQEQRNLREQRGLRFPFDASAEVLLEGRTEKIPSRVTELSFRGCFLETSVALKTHRRVRVKIFHSGQLFEALAEVIYARPTGVGVVFGNVDPHFRKVLQAWILSALDNQAKS